MQVKLQDQTALIIGGGSGLSLALAAALSDGGATLASVAAPGPLDILVGFAEIGGLTEEVVAAGYREATARIRAGGRVVVVVSVTGLVPIRGDATAPAQAATIALVRNLALDLAPRGVRVNGLAIAPDAVAERIRSHVPGGRLPSSQALVDATLYLLDPANTYMTGHVMVADCGWSIGYGRDF